MIAFIAAKGFIFHYSKKDVMHRHKIILPALSILLVIYFSSCQSNGSAGSQNFVDTIDGEQLAKEAELQAANLREQQIEDSIKQEKQRIAKKLLEEERERRIDVATDYASGFTTEFAKLVCPSVRKNVSTYVDDTNYDYDTKKVELTFRSEWDGFPHGPFGKEELHSFKGKITLYQGVDQPKFDKISMNQALEESIDFNNSLEKVHELLDSGN